MEEDGQVILCPGDIVCLVTYQAFSKILLLLKPVSWGNHRLADTQECLPTIRSNAFILLLSQGSISLSFNKCLLGFN